MTKGDKIGIDVGCGESTTLLDVYFEIKSFRKLYGIDNNSQKFNDGTTVISPNDQIRRIKNLYERKEKKVPFEDIFELNYSIRIEDFLITNGQMFDLIIMSNFLHMYDKYSLAKNICKELISRLKPDGLLYLFVANETHRYREHQNRLAFDKQNILNLFDGLHEVNLIRLRSHYEGLFKRT